MADRNLTIVNLNRVRCVGREQYELFDLARDREADYSPPLYESMEAAVAEQDYGAWYIEDEEGNMRGPHVSEREAATTLKEMQAAVPARE